MPRTCLHVKLRILRGVRPCRPGMPVALSLVASCQQPNWPALLRAGFACTRQELSEDIKQLYQTGLFESVNARVLPQKKSKFKVRCTRCALARAAPRERGLGVCVSELFPQPSLQLHRCLTFWRSAAPGQCRLVCQPRQCWTAT